MNGGKIENLTKKTCSEYFKAYGWQKWISCTGVLLEKLRLDLYSVYRKQWMEINMWYVDKRFSNWNFITYIQFTADRSNCWLFIHFYYSKIMKTFSRSFYCFLILFKVLYNDYDVTTLKIIHPITVRNYTKHPIKVFRNKTNMYMQRFYKMVTRTPSEYHCTKCI